MNRYLLENYNNFMNDIIDDILMGKVSIVGNKTIIKGINTKVIDTIKLFYKIAELLSNLYTNYTSPGECNSKYYRVYRRMNLEFTNDSIVQPIPFSNFIMYEYIKPQCNFEGPNYIYIIDFNPSLTNFVSICNENEGKEIILPACILLKTNTTIESNITFYNCIVINQTYSYMDMKELIRFTNSHINVIDYV